MEHNLKKYALFFIDRRFKKQIPYEIHLHETYEAAEQPA